VPHVGWIGGTAPFATGPTPVGAFCGSGDLNPANGVKAEFQCTATFSPGPDGNLFCQVEHGFPDPPKCYTGCPATSNPVIIGTGNKRQVELDYRSGSLFPLLFQRTYNSLSAFDGRSGRKWKHNYDRRVVFNPLNLRAVRAARGDGRVLTFWQTPSGTHISDRDINDRITRLTDGSGNTTGWVYVTGAEEETETYDASGRLLSIATRSGVTQTLTYSDGTATPPNGGVIEGTATPLPAGLLLRVTDHFGRTLGFGYKSGFSSSLLVARVTDPAGGNYTYQYDTFNNLTSVSSPDGFVRTYHYNETGLASGPQRFTSLTGITDENSSRFATYTYAADGRAIRTEHAGGAERQDLAYNTDGTVTVTDAFGVQRTYGFQTTIGVPRGTGIAGGACPSCGPASQSFDTNGNFASRTDWNGNRTNYTYDLPRNLETQRLEGLTSSGGTTAQTRTITTEWHATWRLPTRIAEPLRITTNVYGEPNDPNAGNRGSLLSRSIQATTDANGSLGIAATPMGAPRVWTYTYNTTGQMLTMNGPRTDVADVTTYTYHAANDPDFGKRGNVATITNPLGHVTTIGAYNAHGQPLSMTDPNGLVTAMTYDLRQRLTSRTVGGETTGYEYDGVGQLTKVTLPDGSFLSYSYDGAHRLTGMQDNLGNRIAYTLDAMGNRTQEQGFDPANSLAQTRSRVYSNLNRLFQEIGAQAQTTEYGYDTQGNVTSVKDPLNRTTANAYDALNRLAQVTDPASGVTQYGYNGLDALTSVSDPRNLVTGYTVDGLGNLTQQLSPDTGTTASTYDAAGNLFTQTDAKGQVTTYGYDALNRVTSITFQDGSKQTYAYDQGTNGIGRLTGITELNPAQQVLSTIAYLYTVHGRVTSETRTIGGVSYATGYSYDSAGRMSGMTYPSGRALTYSFDALGRVSQVTTTKDSQTQTVVQNVQYHPFGGAKSWTLGNGQIYSRTIDLDGRIASYSLGGANYAIRFDAASRINCIAQDCSPAVPNIYGYDNLDRLTSAVLPGSNFAYSYDAVGNRLTKTTGAATDTYTYGPTSNRIATLAPASGPVRSFTFDANGSTTADGLNTYAYDTRGRMVQATSVIGATSYQVNALGQRARKTNSQGDAVFHYDTRGRLIAETDPGGGAKRELIYLGDIPVGVVQ